jgi:ribosomal protein L34E
MSYIKIKSQHASCKDCSLALALVAREREMYRKGKDS